MIISLYVVWLADGDVNVVFRRLLLLAREQIVDVAGGATVNLVLLWNVSGIARQVVLLVLNEGLGTHFLKLSKLLI